MKRQIISLLVMMTIGMSQALAADSVMGRQKAQQMCQTCHGLDGQATVPMAANLSGQNEDYLIIQMKNYRSGKRQHEQMSIIAQTLSDDDIDNVARWYSSIAVTLTLPN